MLTQHCQKLCGLQACSQAVLASSLDLDTVCISAVPIIVWDNTSITSRLLPSKSLPCYYSPISVPLDAVYLCTNHGNSSLHDTWAGSPKPKWGGAPRWLRRVAGSEKRSFCSGPRLGWLRRSFNPWWLFPVPRNPNYLNQWGFRKQTELS
jgi:hypothetical protein